MPMAAMKGKAQALLERALAQLQVESSQETLDAFDSYLGLLRKWSRAYNLTALRDEEEIVRKHFIDSLSYLRAVPEGAGTLLDVGTGAGFPGVPLKIARPGLEVFLLEPSRKKVSFLKNLIKNLSLEGCSVIRGRVEDYPCGYGGVPASFDVIVTRALFGVREFVEMSSGLCSAGGIMVISRGRSAKGETVGLEGHEYEMLDAGLAAFGLERVLISVRP